jgi:membrane dipeptidase
MLDRARALHARVPVVELHSDAPLDVWRRRRAGETAPLAGDWLQRWREGGVDVSVVTVGGDMPASCDGGGRPDLRSREMIADVLAEEEACPGLGVVRTAADLDAAARGDRLGLVLHLEGVRPLRGRLDTLHQLHALGLRSAGITWNPGNEAADGVGVADPHGLTPFGRDLVRELGRLRLLIDVSHLAEPGVRDVLDLAEGPVVASHSNADGLHLHIRNVTDAQARAIAATGGLVGLCCFPQFIGSPATVEGLVDHAVYLAGLIGVQHLAIGPDYAEGVVEAFVADMATDPVYGGGAGAGGGADGGAGAGAAPGPAAALALPDWAVYPEGLRRVETLPVLTAALLARGFSDDECAAILGGNALRVLRSLLPAG